MRPKGCLAYAGCAGGMVAACLTKTIAFVVYAA
jgi:hypothetical protein